MGSEEKGTARFAEANITLTSVGRRIRIMADMNA